MDDKNVISKITKDLLLKSKLNNNGSKQTQVFVIPPELLKGLIPENKQINADISTKVLVGNAKSNDTSEIRKSVINKNKNIEDDSKTKNEDFLSNDYQNSKTVSNVNKIMKLDNFESIESDVNRVLDNSVLKDSDYLVQKKSVKSNAITEVIKNKDSVKDIQGHKEKEFISYSKVRKKGKNHQKQENKYKGDNDVKAYNKILTASSVQHSQTSVHVIEESHKSTLDNFLPLKTMKQNSPINSCKISSNNEKLAIHDITTNIEDESLISTKKMNSNTNLLDNNQFSPMLSQKQQQEYQVYNEVISTNTTNDKKDNKILSKHTEKQQEENQIYNEVVATDTTNNKEDVLKNNKVSSNHSEEQQEEHTVCNEVLATDTHANKKDISKGSKVSNIFSEKQQQDYQVYNEVVATDTTDNKKDILKDNKVSFNHSEKQQEENQIYDEASGTDTTVNKIDVLKHNKVSSNRSEKQQEKHAVCNEVLATDTIDTKKDILRDNKVSFNHSEEQQEENQIYNEVVTIDTTNDKKDILKDNFLSSHSEIQQKEQNVYNEVSVRDITDNKKNNELVELLSGEMNQDNEIKDDDYEIEVIEEIEYIVEEILEIEEPMESQEMLVEIDENNEKECENEDESQTNACFNSKSYVREECNSDGITFVEKKEIKPKNVYVNKKKLNNQRKNDNLSTGFWTENNITLPHNVIVANSLTEKSTSTLKNKNEGSSEISILEDESTIIKKEGSFTKQNKKKLLKIGNCRNSVDNFNLDNIGTIEPRLRSRSMNLNAEQSIKSKDLNDLKTVHKSSIILQNEVTCDSNDIDEIIETSIGNKINEKNIYKQTCNVMDTTTFKRDLALEKFTDRSFENINLTDVIDNNIYTKNKDERSTENDEISKNEQPCYGFYEDTSLVMLLEKFKEKSNDLAGSETILDMDPITETNKIIENRENSIITKNNETYQNQQQNDFYEDKCLSVGSEISEKYSHFAGSETIINTLCSTEATANTKYIPETNKIDENEEDNKINKTDETFEYEQQSYGFYEDNNSLSMGSETSEEKNNDFADLEIKVNAERIVETTIDSENITEINKSEERLERKITESNEILENQKQSYGSCKDNSLSVKSQKFVETDKVKIGQKDNKNISSSFIKIKSNEKISNKEVQNIFDKLKRSINKTMHSNSNSEFAKLNTSNDDNTRKKICSDNDKLQYETQVVTKLNKNIKSGNYIIEQNIHPTISYSTKEKSLKRAGSNLNIQSKLFKNRRKSTTDIIHKKTEILRTRTESLNLDDKKLKQLNNNENFEVKKISNSPTNQMLSSQDTMEKEENKFSRSASNKVIDNVQYDDKTEDQEFEYLKIKDKEYDSLLKSNEFNEVTVQQHVKSTYNEKIDVSQEEKKESKDEKVSDLDNINLTVSHSRRRGRPPKLSKTISTKNQSIKEDNDENKIEKLFRADSSQSNNAYKEETETNQLDAVNVHKRKKGRPPKRTKRSKNSNVEVKDLVIPQKEEKSTDNVESIQESLSKTGTDTCQITNHVHEDMKKDIEEANSTIIKRKGRRPKSKVSEVTTDVSFMDLHNDSVVAGNVDFSVAHNNENISHEDSHNLSKKRRGRSRSLKKLNPFLLSSEKQNSMQMPDNEEESLNVKNSNNILDSNNLKKTIEVNTPLNCSNSEITYDECSKLSKDFHNNLSTKDKVDSSVPCNNKILNDKDTVQKRRRGRPPALKKEKSELLRTEELGPIEKHDNKKEFLGFDNLEITKNETDESNKTFYYNALEESKKDCGIACSSEIIGDKEPQVAPKKRRGRPPSAKKLKQTLLSTDRSLMDNTDNKEALLDFNSPNTPLNSHNVEMITEEADKSRQDTYNNSSAQKRVDSSIACDNENLNCEGPNSSINRQKSRSSSLEKSCPILLREKEQSFIEKTVNEEESLDLNSTNNLLQSNNTKMSIEADKPIEDSLNNSSEEKKVDYSFTCNNKNISQKDLDTGHNRTKSRSPSLENLSPLLSTTENKIPIEKLDNKGELLLNSENLEKPIDENNRSSKNLLNSLPAEDKIDSNTTCNNEMLIDEDSRSTHKKRRGRPPRTLRKSNRVSLTSEKQSAIENPDDKIESLDLNSSTRRRGRRRLIADASNSSYSSENLNNATAGQNVESSSISINKDNSEYEATTKNDVHEKTPTLECETPRRRTRRSKLIDDFSGNKVNEDDTNNDMDLNVSTQVNLRKRNRNRDTTSPEFDDVNLHNRRNLISGKGLSFKDESENDDEDESDNDYEKNLPTKTRSRKRKCRFNIYQERKRGRPKGTQSKQKCDEDYVPHHSQLPRSSKKANTKLNTSTERTATKIISCGKCKKEMMKNQWSHHNLSAHNNLGWIHGTPKPDYENNEKLLKRILFITIKKRRGSLICETCNSLKRSVLGYLSHVIFCGKDDEEKQALMVTCPVCKAVTKPSSLEYHERLHKAQAEEKEKLALLEAEDSGLRTKRKAAEKAVTKISEFTALVKDDKISVPVDKKSKPDIILIYLKRDEKVYLKRYFSPNMSINWPLASTIKKKLIQKPQLTKRIPNIVVSKWKKDLDIGKKPICSQVGCHFVCESLDEMKLHYSTCNFTPQENFVCKICHFKSSSEDEILNHAMQKHSTEDDGDVNLEISDIESSNSDNNSDVENSNDKNKGLIKKFFFRESSESANKMFKFLFKDGECHSRYNRTFSPAFQWTLEFEQKNYKFELFKEYIPNTFELLSAEESKTYLPELDQSMMMKTIKLGNRDSPESIWKKWKRFEGQCVFENPTFFVGGPVWALAWLPIPSTLAFSENLSQFIAISTHSTMDAEFYVGSINSGKNIIQIWNLGDLNHKVGAKTSPELAYAIAHDGGTVWCLEWCPSGCYQSDDVLPKKSKEDNSKRMGLLAAACSDGCIRVYSLVFPEDLPCSEKDYKIDEDSNTTYPIYKTEPALLLVVNRIKYESNQETSQVTKLSWTKEINHNVIVAGFSNGYVALWDLSTKSPLLKSKKGNTVILQPYKCFFAHHHVVTMVYLIPQNEKRFLATGSSDRYFKFWDLQNTNSPNQVFKRGFVTNGTFLNHWCTAFITYDDALSMNHNYTYCVPIREYTYKYYNILPSNSTCYGIDASDFGNSIAKGTLAGEVLAIFPQQLIYIRDMEKTLPRKRNISMISSLEVVDFDTTSKDGNLLKTDKDEMKNETIFMPSTYAESKDRFGIKFLDKMNFFREDNFTTNPRGCRKTLTCDMMQRVPIEQYPFMSANRISWNPNAWSFLWLAVGYQNGFVRLTSFKSLASTVEWNKLLASHIETLKSENSTTSS